MSADVRQVCGERYWRVPTIHRGTAVVLEGHDGTVFTEVPGQPAIVFKDVNDSISHWCFWFSSLPLEEKVRRGMRP